MALNILLTFAEGVDLVLCGCGGLLGGELDVCLPNGYKYTSMNCRCDTTYPLLLPLTLCSLKVMSFNSSSQFAWLTQPRISSSVFHQ